MTRLHRDINLLGASLLVLNGLIGAGIFALPEKLYLSLGDFSPWVFPIFALLMMSVAWCFAELTKHYPQTGGPVVYTTQAFGPFVGFQTGWLFFLARATALAANAHVLILYASYLAPMVEQGVMKSVALAAVLTALTLGNLVGVRRAMQLLDGLTVVKVLPIIVITVIALSQSSVLPLPGKLPDIGALEAGALLSLYALIGFENVVVTGGETQNPRRNMPRAIMFTLAATAALYFVVQLAYISWRPGQQVDGPPLVALGEWIAGYWGAIAIMVAAVFSIAANLLASMVSTSRVPLAMANNQQIPAFFAHLHTRFATPDVSIIMLGVMAIGLALSGSFVWLAVVSVLSRLTMYICCVLALWAAKKGQNQRIALRHSANILLALTVCCWAIAQSDGDAWAMLIAEFVVGVVLYGAYRKLLPSENSNAEHQRPNGENLAD